MNQYLPKIVKIVCVSNNLMLWIALPLLLSCSISVLSLSLFYSTRPKQFIKPSPSFLGYMDPTFIEWTDRLIDKGLQDEKHWFLQHPGHIFFCCPQVKSMRDDPVLLAQLTDMTPAHKFAYTLARKLAEASVQFCAGWLPYCPVLLAAYCCKYWTVILKDESEKSSKYANQSFNNLKRTFMVLSLVPLSILLPCLSELAFDGILDYQKRLIHGNMVGDSYFHLLSIQIKDVQNEINKAPSFLHLFNFFRLHRSLYGDIKLPSDATVLCQQTQLSLSYWSVLVFVGTVYAIAALALRAFVWQPVKKFCSLLTKDKMNPPCLFSNKDSQTIPSIASKKRRRSSRPEPGDGSSKGSIAKKPPVRPRYVSRGTFANLDSESFVPIT